NHTMVGSTRGFDQAHHFLLAQNHWESLGAFWINQIDLAVGSPKHSNEKESEGGNPPADRFNRELAIIQQIQLILSQVFLSKLIRTSPEVRGTILHRKQVRSDGLRRVVSTLDFFQHPLT